MTRRYALTTVVSKRKKVSKQDDNLLRDYAPYLRLNRPSQYRISRQKFPSTAKGVDMNVTVYDPTEGLIGRGTSVFDATS
jgi:hypothetical protein